MGFRFLEHKLSLIVFPILFFLHSYNSIQRERVYKFFVLGLLAASICLILNASLQSFLIEKNNLIFQPNILQGKGFLESILYGGNRFFGKHFSIFHQTVYFALYLTIGISILLFRPSLFAKQLRVNFILILTFILFLVSNKASFLCIPVILGFWIFSRKLKLFNKWIGLVGLLLFFTLFALINPRVRESVKTVAETNIGLQKNARYGFATRLLSWDAALSLIKEKPILGYGFSNVQTHLNERYRKKKYIFPLKEEYNAHNLWLQSWLENGVLSIIILVVVFVTLFKKSASSSLLLCITTVFLINSMFEGIFNRFSGISFFSFVFCLIITWPKIGASNNEV
ncbi:O-antigen ligase family protein [Flagellimonas spongiicola]|uniref:O-antigen ligase family protein n=1 Tax=Flagellimonas spongiicola TaxID=2942208 RepID=UPI003AAD3B25